LGGRGGASDILGYSLVQAEFLVGLGYLVSKKKKKKKKDEGLRQHDFF
jgi:hypothetical protein